MGAFRFSGIPEAVAREVRESLRAPGYGHPAHREQAHGYGPCRLCLRTFRVGADERILFTYNPFHEPGELPAPGPVFIHAEPCQRYDAFELRDALVDTRGPASREARPVPPGRRALRRQLGELCADLLERQADPLGEDYERDAPQRRARKAPVPGARALGLDEAALLVEAQRRGGDAAAARNLLNGQQVLH